MTHAVVSVDGFIADEKDDVGPLFDWYFNGDRPIYDDASFRVGAASIDYVKGMWDDIGAIIQGRRLFDQTNGWEARPPAGDNLLVVSHRPKPDGWHPEADVPFFDDLAAAIEEAKRRAGDRTVAVCAGDMGGQAVAAGLVDIVAMDVVPVVFGRRRRYFGPIDAQHLLEDPHVVIQGDRVLHLQYRVRR
ncbi:dihydrofolate reductase family protein [Nocardioides panacisoli]|uniref:Dihydrofolate reductase family protein n=2 Tax=Nocardioides panacisoli TaxID=627624 RepID=A0ABP7I8G3_9ACTN